MLHNNHQSMLINKNGWIVTDARPPFIDENVFLGHNQSSNYQIGACNEMNNQLILIQNINYMVCIIILIDKSFHFIKLKLLFSQKLQHRKFTNLNCN